MASDKNDRLLKDNRLLGENRLIHTDDGKRGRRLVATIALVVTKFNLSVALSALFECNSIRLLDQKEIVWE